MVNTPIDKPVYVLTYALTKGILVFGRGEMHDSRDGGPTYFVSKEGGYSIFASPKEYTQDRDEAIRRYHDMVGRKLKSVQAQAKKLTKMLDDAPHYEDVP